ncbi:MAG: M48 family metalloprotease, partial [Candidatus Bathyarchaeia archaeon]
DFIKQNYPRERLLQIKKDIYDRTLALGKPIDTQTVQEVFYEHGINIKLENLLVKNINVYEIVKRVSKQFNINMPKIRIANIIVPNAAATGPSPRFSLVLITTGLLIQLDEEEIFAVVGHEISHVKSRDPLALFLITSAEYLFRVYVLWPFILIFGFLYILFALTLVYFVAKFFEARADLESALILGKPGALANALRKIGYRRIWMERASNRVGSWLNMDPHPPLSFRIERLESLSESEPWRIKHPFLQSIKDCVNGLLRELGI